MFPSPYWGLYLKYVVYSYQTIILTVFPSPNLGLSLKFDELQELFEELDVVSVP